MWGGGMTKQDFRDDEGCCSIPNRAVLECAYAVTRYHKEGFYSCVHWNFCTNKCTRPEEKEAK